MADTPSTDTPKGEAATSAVTSFSDRIGEVVKYLVGGLAVVASAAVTRLGLEKLGSGDPGRPYTGPGGWEISSYLLWALISVAGFTIGVVVILSAVVWLTRAGRVTLDYLIDDRGFIARKVRRSLARSTYLMGGKQSLTELRQGLNELMAKPRPLAKTDTDVLKRLLAARTTVLETAKAERVRHVSGFAVLVVGAGAVLASFSAATFAYVTNRAEAVRSDREESVKDVVVGELLPHAPSDVLLVVPDGSLDRGPIAHALGTGCELSGAKAVLFEVAAPPEGAVPSASPENVFHVVTEATGECTSTSLWVPAEWVMARPTDD